MKKQTFFYLFLLLLPLFSACSSEDSENNYDKPYNPQQPLIVSSIGPEKGGLGTRVVVSGSNFGNDPSKVKLFFNEKEALILKLQNNAIYAMVPKQPGDYSTIKVVINEGENGDGTPRYREAVLEGVKFKYNIKATVTTVAGTFGVFERKDGLALEASFGRPVMLAVDNENTILISDDRGGSSIRMLSLQDNKLSTVLPNLSEPWQCSFDLSFNRFYVMERSIRPLLFYQLSRETNWQESKIFYDQKNEKDEYIVGQSFLVGLTADDKYVYLISDAGRSLYRVDQESGKIDLIGENLNFIGWTYLAYNPKDHLIYVTAEDWGRLYRFDPYKTPIGHVTPWITSNDIEHIVGTGKGPAKEGNGKSAQLGALQGLSADQDGNIYIADYLNHVIWKVDQELNATIFAGVPGESGYRDGKPSEALFNMPYDVASTPDGIIYVADQQNSLIRCIAIQ